MNEQPDKEEFANLLDFLESIENQYSIKLMKKERDKTRKIITILSGISPEGKIDTNRFIAKSLIREDLLDCLYELNKN